MLRLQSILILFLIAACSPQPVIDDEMMRFDGTMPADFSGSWERNYTRGDDVNAVLREMYYKLSRISSDLQGPGNTGVARPSQRDMSAVLALAHLADEITSLDVLTIAQNEHEISIERKDDFAMWCAFHDGVATDTDNAYGVEICGWDGEQLVSNLTLPDGLQVTHRFTVSEDGKDMRVVTTVSSSSSRLPFTLRRFYTKFDRPASDFNCVETFSKKRVCSTGEIVP